jgi:paraquat-inducible protein A
MDSATGGSLDLSEVWLACPRCRADCRDRDLRSGEFLLCSRCGSEVKSSKGGRTSILAAWAFSTTALLLMLLANSQPILKFDVAGNSQENLIATGVEALWDFGYGPLAALVGFSAIAAPALYLLSAWYVSAACILRLRWPWRRFFFRMAMNLESWNLMPVFAVACVVSVVKLRTLGSVTWEPGAVWVALLAVFTLLTIQSFDRRHVMVDLEENP